MEYISSSFFSRFIGVPTIIKINDTEIIIEIEKRLIKIKWHDLIVPPTFHLSFFGQIITLRTIKRNYVFTMLAYNSKRKQKSNCELFWALANIKRVEALLASIKELSVTRYIRQSTIQHIEFSAIQECNRWFSWLPLNQPNQPNQLNKIKNSCTTWANIIEKLQQLSYYKRWNEQGIDDSRKQYINKQLQIHKAFFDTVESNPLTLHQRKACIIDNDNNLLLAGAGTGKTSVMVGRTGYLLKSGQARSDEILLLAYGRKAANEMDERIKNKLSIDTVNATTFHRLGLNIIAQVEGVKPSISVFAEDEKAKAKWVQHYFEKLINENPQYRKLIVEYFSRYYYVERSAFDFKSLGEYHQYFNDNDIRTFKGEQVKSFGELYIANNLFCHGIEYQYEAKYVYDVKTINRMQYQPDFFLPELNIYIEYYGIDENGNTAAYIDQNAYHEGIEWKQATHRKHNTECLELTYAHHKKGLLLSTLMTSLNDRQVQFNMLPAEQLPTEVILETINESGRITMLAQIFSQLIGLYKAACLDSTLERNVITHAKYPKQTEKALALLEPILMAYEHQLTSHKEIDFEDMINKALAYVQNGQFQSPWRYIMVDEFQDISEPRARLVKALRDNNKACSIFAVGDDWQAIYQFSGADFKLTTQFASYFGATPQSTTQSVLDLTFRFNNQIGKVATDFITKNPEQIKKSIKSLKQVNTPTVSLLKRDNGQFNSQNSTIIDEMANGALDDVLSAISSKVCKPVTVYLLARFWFLLPNNIDLKRLNNQYPLLTIESQSFHASKGKEADYVIIVGMKTGSHGFPSEKATPALIEALLPKQEAYKYAEERRLFYVALTRAKDKVYIIADMAESNHFIKELIDDQQIELNEFDSTLSQTYVNELNCLVCETGKLKKRVGRYGAFYACSNSPRCDHKEKPCDQCESPMTRKRYPGFKVCLNDACKNLIPTCSQCSAEMVLRSGKNGKFWGCKNYKGNEPMSCKNSLGNLEVTWPEMSVKTTNYAS